MACGLLPVAGVVVAAGALAAFVQVGPVWAWDALKPRASALNPIEGIKKRIFSLRQAAELLKALLKVVVVGTVCWMSVRSSLRDVVLSAGAPAATLTAVLGRLIGVCVRRSLLAFLPLAVLDLLYQRWQYRREQRMSKEEVKREQREQEGDPLHKQGRRRLRQEIATNNMLRDIRARADVIVRNPRACAVL